MNFDGIHFPHYEVPLDEEDPRFIKSFELVQAAEINEFFRHFGFVVIRGILNEDECEATIQDIWRFMEPLSREDSTTWNKWPKAGHSKYGMPTMEVVSTATAIRNRVHENVYKAFETVLSQREEPLLDIESQQRLKLMVSHDRYGTMRPTVDVQIGNTISNRADWKTSYNVHLDMDPWKYFNLLKEENSLNVTKSILNRIGYNRSSDFIRENNVIHPSLNQSTQIHVQGSIALDNNFDEDGGFVCVPGFHNYLEEWATKTLPIKKVYLSEENPTAYSIRFSVDHPINKAHLRVSVPRGGMIIWDQRLPHGSGPNKSSRWRYVQFLKMFATDCVTANRKKARAAAITQFLRPLGDEFKNELSPLALELLGLS